MSSLMTHWPLARLSLSTLEYLFISSFFIDLKSYSIFITNPRHSVCYFFIYSYLIYCTSHSHLMVPLSLIPFDFLFFNLPPSFFLFLYLSLSSLSTSLYIYSCQLNYLLFFFHSLFSSSFSLYVYSSSFLSYCLQHVLYFHLSPSLPFQVFLPIFFSFYSFLSVSPPSIYLFLSLLTSSLLLSCPVNWGCRIHWLHLCRGVRPPPHTHTHT